MTQWQHQDTVERCAIESCEHSAETTSGPKTTSWTKKVLGNFGGTNFSSKKISDQSQGHGERNQKQLWRCPNFLSCSLLISSSCVCGSLTPGSSRNTKTAGFQSPEYYVFHIKDTHSMVPNMCKSPSITRVSRECLTLCGRD